MERSSVLTINGSGTKFGLPHLAGVFLLGLSLFPLGALSPIMAVACGFLSGLWLLSWRRRGRARPVVLGTALFLVLGAAVARGVGGTLPGPASTLFRHDAMVSFIVFTAAVLSTRLPRGKSARRVPAIRSGAPLLRDWGIPLVAFLGAAAIVVFFLVLVHWGDTLWVIVRPVGHDLLVIAAGAFLVASAAERIVYRAGRIRWSLSSLLMAVVLPAHVAGTCLLNLTQSGDGEEGAKIARIRDQACDVVSSLSRGGDAVSPRADGAGEIEALLEEHPGDHVLNLYAALVFAAGGDLDEADEALLAAAKGTRKGWTDIDLVGPRTAEFGIRRMLRLGQWEAARGLCEAAIDQFPESETVQMLSADVRALSAQPGEEEISTTVVPETAHREYLLGIAAEVRGKAAEAEQHYAKSCAVLPRHRRSWKALERLAIAHPGLHPPSERERIEAALAQFELPIALAEDVHGFATVTGGALRVLSVPHGEDVVPATAHRLSPAAASDIEVIPGSEVELELQVEFESRCELTAQDPILRRDRWIRKRIADDSVDRLRGEWGEIRSATFPARIPENTLPGEYEVRLLIDAKGAEDRGLPLPPVDMVLTRILVLHRLQRVALARWKIESLYGNRAFKDAGYRAVVAADWGVEIPVRGEGFYSGCILVTGVSYGAGIEQGETVAEVSFVERDGKAFTAPLRMGFETAEIYADRPSRGGSTGNAKVWGSFAVSADGEEFDGHIYHTHLSFPHRMELEKALIEVAAPQPSYVHVYHLVLVEANENQDG